MKNPFIYLKYSPSTEIHRFVRARSTKDSNDFFFYICVIVNGDSMHFECLQLMHATTSFHINSQMKFLEIEK